MNHRLYRSIKDPKIAGVCSGIAEYFNIDPVLVRILFVFMLFFGMMGFFIYIVLAIIIPKEPINPEIQDPNTENTETTEPKSKEEVKKDFEQMGKDFGAKMEDMGKGFDARLHRQAYRHF